MFRRDNIKLVVIATVCLLIGLSAPAVGHGVRHALFAHNADKVDGKHAVGSGASIANRSGKLVATDPNSGLLPNNIIATAPDADRVDGFHADQLARAARMIPNAALTLSPTAEQTFGPALSITAPTAGFVVINATATINNIGSSCTTGCNAFGRVRHIQTGTHSNLSIAAAHPASDGQTAYTNVGMHNVFPVAAGENTFDIRLFRGSGNGTLRGDFGEMNALFVPFGPTGGASLDPTSASKPKQ
jgi:hypothetical protein